MINTVKLTSKEVFIIMESLESDLDHWESLKGDGSDKPGIDETIDDIKMLMQKLDGFAEAISEAEKKAILKS